MKGLIPVVKRFSAFFPLILVTMSVNADIQSSSTDEALRKAQDPLANVTAIMTDNTISLGTSDDHTAYNFQFQPVYSIPTNQKFNMIARAIIPVMAVPKGAVLPQLSANPISTNGTTWGVSDSYLQLFFVPKTKSDIKFGFGPQVSVRTRTDDAVAGPGWGIGIAGVVFGFSGSLSYGAILGHHEGEDHFQVTTLQPIVFYSTDLLGKGSYIGYNNALLYDWSAPSSNAWQVPVGLTAGRTFLLDSGYMFDTSLGAYHLTSSPSGGADNQIKIGLSLFFP